VTGPGVVAGLSLGNAPPAATADAFVAFATDVRWPSSAISASKPARSGESGCVSDDIPLLEFDPDPVGVLDPAISLAAKRDTIPERAVMCFYAEILEALPEEAEQVGTLEAAHGLHPIWRIRRHGTEIAVFHPGVGAPLAAGFLEEAIVTGARRVVACGGCGVLTPEVSAGDIVIPTSAVRDEGTSYHYLPPSREVEADADGVAAAVDLLTARGVPFTMGKVWTTDALYRETRRKVATRRSEGCIVVEMEAAAFFAVARFRGIRFAQLLYGGDDLSSGRWEDREWTVSPSRARTFNLAVELAATL
jgi:uridine phosphorylase